MKYKIRQGQSIFDLNDGLHAVPEFDILEPRQMSFVALYCDPSKDNPVSNLAGRARREAAVKLAGYGYEPDGKRLDRNARLVRDGHNKRIEIAIEKYKELHYNPRQRSIEALKLQIEGIREFISSDMRVQKLNKNGEPMKDADGKDVMEIDRKMLKDSIDMSKELPELEDALDRLELANKEEDTKFEGVGFIAADVDMEEFAEEDAPPLIELVIPKMRANEGS